MEKIKNKTIFFITVLGLFLNSSGPAVIAAEKQVKDFPRAINLSIEQASRIGLANNFDVQIAKYDAYIKRTEQDLSESVFDTYLNAAASYYNDQSKSSSTLSGTKNTVNAYSIALQKKIPTGTTFGLSFEDDRNYTDSSFASINPNHDATVKVSVIQPLADNFFGMNDRGLIKISRLDIENSDYKVLDRIEDSLAQLQKSYWLLALRYKQLEIAEKMHERALYYYHVFKEKNKLGLVEDAELYAQESNLIQRQVDIEIAQQQLKAAQNTLLFVLNENDFSINIIPQQLTAKELTRCEINQSLQKAIAKRRDYKQASNKVRMKKINLSMKKNSLLPRVDLEASFAHNGLESGQDDAWKNVTEEDAPEMYVGLNFSMPLENRLARAGKKKAASEKAQAIIEMKKTEQRIIVEINNLVDEVNVAVENVNLSKKIVELNRKKLLYEEQRFKTGRSQTDTLVRYQQEYLQAQNALAKNIYGYKTAMIDLRKAENSLLDKYWQERL